MGEAVSSSRESVGAAVCDACTSEGVSVAMHETAKCDTASDADGE